MTDHSPRTRRRSGCWRVQAVLATQTRAARPRPRVSEAAAVLLITYASGREKHAAGRPLHNAMRRPDGRARGRAALI